MLTDEIDIRQIVLISKLIKYFALVEENDKENFISNLELRGHCSGFSALAIIGKNLEELPQRYDEVGNPVLRDDWQWLEKLYIKLSQWSEKLADLSPTDKKDIERFYYHLRHFHHPSSYQPIAQGDLHLLAQFDNQNIKIEKIYSLAGLFTADDFTKSISINEKKTTLLEELCKDNTDLLFGTHEHDLALHIRNGRYHFYDSNYKSGWRTYESDQKNALVKDIFVAAKGYQSDKPSPFYFRVFTMNKSITESYPPQAILLTAVDSAIEPVVADYAANTSALFASSDIGCNESMAYYLNHGANVNITISDGRTPLYVAATNGRLNAVMQLLEHGAEINGNDKKDTTPLFTAAQYGYLDIVKTLAEKGADICKKNKANTGVSPLTIAAMVGNTEIVVYLIQKIKEQTQSDPTLFQKMMKETLLVVIKTKDLISPIPVVSILIENISENVNDIRLDNGYRTETPLYLAASFGKKALVEFFIEKGANVDFDLNNKTPLYAAIAGDHPEIVKILVKNGADVNSICNADDTDENTGETPIITAIKFNRLDIAKILVENGADIFKDYCINYSAKSFTPLKLAAEYSRLHILTFMLEKNNQVHLEHLITVLDILAATYFDNCNKLMNSFKPDFLVKLFIDKDKLRLDVLDEYKNKPDCNNKVYALLLHTALETYRYQTWQREVGSTNIFKKSDTFAVSAADALLDAMEGKLDIQTVREKFATELSQGDIGDIYKHWESIGQIHAKGYEPK